MDPALFPLVHSLYDCYFVEEVAHAVDKDHARLPPTDGPFSQPVRMAPDVSKLPPIVGCRLGINGKATPIHAQRSNACNHEILWCSLLPGSKLHWSRRCRFCHS